MIFGMSTAICLHVLSVPHSLAISAVTVLLLVGAGVFGTDWIRPFYTVWNRGAGLVARVSKSTSNGRLFFYRLRSGRTGRCAI